ncbi:anaerobic selenocysteine-containing dehydrogenase [Nocardioides ginsengisegetis]|uniref:Anaerobic selenocysteine-containing dehydrogenase n=1 Tax=Nocardioides ginsengisegetis TaxID=661491 RepID=A0A7W3J0U7_9ACTN|nr:anaerobic selenocysteine-containing dehydrogenase [Nocardioides ginsengisegetis]
MGILTNGPVPDDFTGTRLGVCNLCEAICGLELSIEGGRVTSIRGNEADPLSRGHICPKGVALADIYDDPDRLRRPVRRIGRGADAEWVEIDWDEALDLVAEGLATAANRHGRDAIGIYLGNPNAHSLGSSTHGLPMIKTLRTRNRFSASSVDQIPHQFVAWQMYGHQLLLPIPDIDRTSYFLVFGANPMASNGSLMTVPDFPKRLRALKKRGGRMVVLDPRRTETAKVASEHHFVRPGSDAVVLLAMLQVLLAEDLISPAAYVDDVEAVRDLVSDFTPEHAEPLSGVPADVIRRITREFAAADGAAAYGRLGVSTHGFGSICQWAIQCLNLLTGNVDREGGLLFPEPAVDAVGRGIIGRGHFDIWRSRVRGIPEYGGELPVSVMREEIETPGDGQIRAVLTVAGNPVLSTPDGKSLARAFDSLDFMAAVDIYLNETTRHADVILPPTTALERDHYDIVFHGLAVRNTARFTPAVFAKPDDARHDWQVFAELARRVQDRLDSKPGLRKRLAQRARFALSPTIQLTALLATGRKVSMRQMRAHPEGVDLGPLRPTLPGRLQTKDKRISLNPTLVTDDLARLRASLASTEVPDPDQLLLIGRRHQQDNNSWMHNTERLTRGKPRHQLLMHPDDLAARDIEPGTHVTVTSRVGSVVVEVAGAEDMMPGVVSLPHGYGHQVDGTRLGHAVKVPGVSINDLTDPERLDVSGNAALNGVPVTVTA